MMVGKAGKVGKKLVNNVLRPQPVERGASVCAAAVAKGVCGGCGSCG